MTQDTPANEYQRGLIDAARICEEHILLFGKPGYAGPNALSSFAERFACKRCADAIRAAADFADFTATAESAP